MTPWTRAPFRWAGSKRRLLPFLLACLPPGSPRYIEPFAGSACLFFAARPRVAILGDFNAELMNAYAVLAAHPRRLWRAVSALPLSASDYYALRAVDTAQSSAFDRAVRFTFLNRYCFNGVYRTNRLGNFNVPYGSRTGVFPSEAQFYRCSVALRAAELMCQDFSSSLGRAQDGDVVYVDPPYSTQRRAYGEYGYGAFGQDDVDRLVAAILSAADRGATVLLSYTNDSVLTAALSGWSIATIQVRRQVGRAASRELATEIIASNRVDVERALSGVTTMTAHATPGLTAQ